MTRTIPTQELRIMSLRHEHEGGCHTHLGSGSHPDCPLCLKRVDVQVDYDAIEMLERLDHNAEDFEYDEL